MKITLRIPSPFVRQKLLAQPEPELDALDADIPFGIHPLIDFVRFSLALAASQVELHRRIRQLRLAVLAFCSASLFATLCQAVQIWANWR